ncbi:MAG TPA: hypothetical protein VN861_03090 [Candidatus Acidoferrales bacterium]|nr:hypothetical protein [Candidatus Acidoferrales bacterium]
MAYEIERLANRISHDKMGFAKRSVDAYLQRLGAKRLVETESGAAMASGELFD